MYLTNYETHIAYKSQEIRILTNLNICGDLCNIMIDDSMKKTLNFVGGSSTAERGRQCFLLRYC